MPLFATIDLQPISDRCFRRSGSRLRSVLLGIALAIATSATMADAGVLYSTFDTGEHGASNFFDRGFSTANGAFGGANWYMGAEFTLTEAASITNLQFLATSNLLDTYSWRIYGSSAHVPAGPLLAGANGISNTVLGRGGASNLFYVMDLDVTNFTLDVGSYFLLFHDESTTAPHQAIVQSRIGFGGIALTGGNFGSNTVLSRPSGSFAIQVVGDPASVSIPEPAAVALFAAGLLGLRLRCRRKRQQSG